MIEGAGIPAEDIRARLGAAFEIVTATADADAGELDATGFDAVLAPPDRLERLTGDVGARLLNSIGEGVCLMNPQGGLVWANDRFRALTEASRERLAAVAKESTDWFAQRLMQPGAKLSELPCKFELSSGEHEEQLESYISPGSRDAGKQQEATGRAASTRPKVDQLAIVVRDVTAAKRRLRKIDAIDRAGAALVRIDAKEVRDMNAIERLGLLERKLVAMFHELLNFDHFSVRLYDESTNKLELVIQSGLPPEAADFDIFPGAEGNGISGWVFSTGRGYICEDALADDLFLPGLEGARSSLTVPLRLHDRVLGVLNIESSAASAFNEEDRQFAEIFARYIAMSLHILDMLVGEGSNVNQEVSGRVQSELAEPLEDLIQEAEWLDTCPLGSDPEAAAHVERIKADIAAIRDKMSRVTSGPQTLLGVERALADRERDPVLDGRRVLVADDEPRIRHILRDVLRGRGRDVVGCAHGGEAIDELERVARGELAAFDLVLSDIKMPDRNGYEVFAAARKSESAVPVILMTGFGYDPHHSIVRASQEGLEAVLFKPLQVEQLLDAVRKALVSHETANS